jgi:hypothetical protein
MSDDWRIRIDMAEEHRGGLLDRLGLDLSSEAHDLAKELEGRRLAVSRDDETIFVYAGSREEAERARAVIEAELTHLGVHGDVTEPEHWLAGEARWSDEAPSEYEPEATARAHGLAPWEVRIDAGSSEAAEQLAGRLEGEGLAVIRRHAYVLVGASSEDEARALASRLHGEVEASGELVYDALPPNPFAIFGGMGGSGTPV